uniref:Uncharacterized protein n=1 Tax=Anguilla anguilla TaxID=7936 RepID=A0A0E9T552_ANGAN
MVICEGRKLGRKDTLSSRSPGSPLTIHHELLPTTQGVITQLDVQRPDKTFHLPATK